MLTRAKARQLKVSQENKYSLGQMCVADELILIAARVGNKDLLWDSVSSLCAATAAGPESVSDLASVDVRMARIVRHAAGFRRKGINVACCASMVELATKITAPVRMDSRESFASHPFARSSVSTVVAVLDQTSAHVFMGSPETAVSKITELVHVTPK